MRSWRDGAAHLIALRGELDLATAHEVERELQDAESGDGAIIVLDLRELAFMDCTGLRVIVAAHRRAASRLIVVKGAPRVQRLFELCDLGTQLTIVDQPPDRSQVERSSAPPVNAATQAAGSPHETVNLRVATTRRVDQAVLAAAVRGLRSRGRLQPIR